MLKFQCHFFMFWSNTIGYSIVDTLVDIHLSSTVTPVRVVMGEAFGVCALALNLKLCYPLTDRRVTHVHGLRRRLLML